MSVEMNEQQLREQVLQDRRTLGLTVDQLYEKYPNLSRSKIGRIIKGTPKGTLSEPPLSDIEQDDNGMKRNEIVPPNMPIEASVVNPYGSEKNPIPQRETARPIPTFEGNKSTLPIGNFPRAPQPSPKYPGSISITPLAIANIRAGMSPAQQKVFDYQLRVCAQEEAQRQNTPYSIRPYPNQPMNQTPLTPREMLTHAQIQDLLDRRRDKNNGNSMNPMEMQKLLQGERQSMIDLFKMMKAEQPQANSLTDMLGQIKTTLTFMEGLEHQRGLTPVQRADIERTKVIYENVGKALQNAVQFGISYLGGKAPEALLNKVKQAKNPNVSTFSCEGCQNILSVPIPSNAPEILKVICPNCEHITELKAKSPVEVKPKEEAPKEETPPERTRLSPTYR